jgi:hypothetical protein
MNFRIDCRWDDEARVWYVEESNVPGLAAEAPTVEALTALLNVRVPEMLSLNMPHVMREPEHPSSFEVVTHRQHELASAC